MVVIIMRQIMRVTIPIYIKNVDELRKSIGCKKKTEQNMMAMTRQYPITRVLRWRVTDAYIISSSRTMDAR